MNLLAFFYKAVMGKAILEKFLVNFQSYLTNTKKDLMSLTLVGVGQSFMDLIYSSSIAIPISEIM